MKVFTFDARGRDGLTYGVRLLLEDDEFDQLQRVGIIPLCAVVVVLTVAAVLMGVPE